MNKVRLNVGQPLQIEDGEYDTTITISVLSCQQTHVGALRPGDLVSYFSGIVIEGPGVSRMVEGYMMVTSSLDYEPRLLSI